MNQKIKRILALLGVGFLTGLYVLTLVFALLRIPNWFAWFQACIFCTVAIPVLLYAMQLIYKILKKKHQ